MLDRQTNTVDVKKQAEKMINPKHKKVDAFLNIRLGAAAASI
jgi:hypothetical protein